MQIQTITNLRNYNNYQVKPCNIAKYSTLPMAVDTFTSSVAFKGVREAQKAIENDDAEALRREIEKGLDVNSILDVYNRDPLIEYAGFTGSINCFRELRKHDVNMYAEDRWGNFCFSLACANGKNDIVQELVNDPEYRINYQRKSDGGNGLMRACCYGKEDTVDIILKHDDVDLTLRNKFEQTAEDIAREKGYDKIVRKLQNYAKEADRRTGVTGANKVNQAAFDMKKIQEIIEKDDAEALKREIENGLDVNRVLDTDDKDPLIEYAGRYGSINCFRELRKHDVNMYAENKYGNFCFSSACYCDNNDIIQELVNDPEYNINYQNTQAGWTGLMAACFCEKEGIVDIILQRPDVDLTLTSKFGKTAQDIANGYNKIVRKLQAYVPGVDRRKNVQTPVKNAAFATQRFQEKQAELEEKEAKLNEREAKLEETIQARTDEIYKQARIDAQKEIEKQKADLAKQQEELEQEKQTLDNMINNYQTLHAEDLRYDRETLASGLMSVYGINPPEKLPEDMKFGEQVVYVMNVLVPRQDKFADVNDEMPETITKAIQDDSKKISNEGLNFLERIIDLSKDKCSENELISAIKSVKGNYGSFDMGKVSLFIRTLSWGNNTIQSSIKKVQKLAV